MLIKTTLIAATAAIGLTGAAMADEVKGPRLMTDQEMGAIVAGADLFIDAKAIDGPGHVTNFDPLTVYNNSEENADDRTKQIYVGWPEAGDGLSNAETQSGVVRFE